MRHEFGQFGRHFPWMHMGFVRPQRFFEAGEIRLAILSLLAEGPKHGYQIMKELGERSGGAYKASAGSVYPTLQQLEDEGMVTAETINGRRTFTLTDEGRQELASDPESVRRIWERAGSYEDWRQFMGPESATVFMPLVMLFRSGLQAARRVGGKPEGADRIREIVDRTRRELDAL